MCNLSMKMQLYLVKKDKIKGFFAAFIIQAQPPRKTASRKEIFPLVNCRNV